MFLPLIIKADLFIYIEHTDEIETKVNVIKQCLEKNGIDYVFHSCSPKVFDIWNKDAK